MKTSTLLTVIFFASALLIAFMPSSNAVSCDQSGATVSGNASHQEEVMHVGMGENRPL